MSFQKRCNLISGNPFMQRFPHRIQRVGQTCAVRAGFTNFQWGTGACSPEKFFKWDSLKCNFLHFLDRNRSIGKVFWGVIKCSQTKSSIGHGEYNYRANALHYWGQVYLWLINKKMFTLKKVIISCVNYWTYHVKQPELRRAFVRLWKQVFAFTKG